MFIVSCGIAYADKYYGYYIWQQPPDEDNSINDIHSFINTIVTVNLFDRYDDYNPEEDLKQEKHAKDHGLNYIIGLSTCLMFTMHISLEAHSSAANLLCKNRIDGHCLLD